MIICLYIILIVLIAVASAGCSKKKEEAKKLQDEMAQRDTVVDTVVDTVTHMTPDTTRISANAGAIPSDEMSGRYMPRQPQGQGFTVQVAGTTGQEDARRLIDLYTKRGYEPFLTAVQVGGATVYRVRIGEFQTYAEAKKVKTELADKFSINPWIDQLGK